MKKGDQVVCIKSGNWQVVHYGKGHDLVPKKDEVVTISRINRDDNNFLLFEEYGNFNSYDKKWFRKVEPKNFTNELTAELAHRELERCIERIEVPKREKEVIN